MIRIYKHYQFNFHHHSVKSQRSSHSSYAGFISSSDDFYVLDTGLVVAETTISILNEKLYNLCEPATSVLAWVRNLVANRMANSGEEWCNIYKEHNSGTYNNQWLIVDYKRFDSGTGTLNPGALYVMELIPGFVEIKDMTPVLQSDSYWASYNRPYFESINEKSMYGHFTTKHGEMFSYRNCPRAKIFHRDHSSVRIADCLLSRW